MTDGPKHADPVFRRIRDQMNRASNANPATVCRRCGLTRTGHPDGDVWTTGHPDGPGDTGYAPEMRSCNSRLSAQQTNAKRLGFDAGL
jgi:hypothetical protein